MNPTPRWWNIIFHLSTTFFLGAIPFNSSRYCTWLKSAYWNPIGSQPTMHRTFQGPKVKGFPKTRFTLYCPFWSLCNLWGRNCWISRGVPNFKLVHFPSSQKLAGRHRSASNFPGRRATSVSATERNAEWMQICKLSNIKQKTGKSKWLVASSGDLFGKCTWKPYVFHAGFQPGICKTFWETNKILIKLKKHI